MDTLEITTETRTLETLEQAAEALKETDSGMIREWLKGLVPEVLGFALQILFAVVLYVIGSRVKKIPPALAGKSGCGRWRQTVFRCAVEIFFVFCFGSADFNVIWRDGSFRGCSDWLCGPCAWACGTGKFVKLCRRGLDSSVKTV